MGQLLGPQQLDRDNGQQPAGFKRLAKELKRYCEGRDDLDNYFLRIAKMLSALDDPSANVIMEYWVGKKSQDVQKSILNGLKVSTVKEGNDPYSDGSLLIEHNGIEIIFLGLTHAAAEPVSEEDYTTDYVRIRNVDAERIAYVVLTTVGESAGFTANSNHERVSWPGDS